MNKCKILIPVSCRSDDPLTRPTIEKIYKNEDFFEPLSFQLRPGKLYENHTFLEYQLDINTFDADCIFIVGDRMEMFMTAIWAFHHNIPIIHYGSGVTNTIATYDDINRHSISLMADVCLCEDKQSAQDISLMKYIIQKQSIWYYGGEVVLAENIHIVGNLYLEGLEDIDESLVPNESYNLMLLNPETINPSDIYLSDTDILTILIEKNADHWLKEWVVKYGKYYDNLPRSQFLGLMKNASRFITNSSSAFYEAMPLGLKREQIILVGNRNKNRSTPMEWNQDYKSSDKIVEIIKKWWLEKNEEK